MPQILLLGSGFVAGPCLSYLSSFDNYEITVAARRTEAASELVKNIKNAKSISLDVDDQVALEREISKVDLVISLIPYIHHVKVINAAIKTKKHVVTTSYVSQAMQDLHDQAKEAGITVFNEIGVDPGIDHLYAIKTIDEVHKKGGKILEFTSYCGGLPSPEASNNPLGYKFSWSSRGVLLALKNSAKFLQGGEVKEFRGDQLMDSVKEIPIYPAFAFVGYPNRDSTPYTQRYSIPECQTLIRGTLRYSVFPGFVKVLSSLGFLNDSENQFVSLDHKIQWKELMQKILETSNSTEESLTKAIKEKCHLSKEKEQEIFRGLRWLGLFSSDLVKCKGNLLDTLCALLEEKMMYLPGERDMVMLQHKFKIQWKDGSIQNQACTGLWFGEPNGPSAMATTVGVPAGIATRLILEGVIKERGVLAPMTPDLVYPIITELESLGIKMTDEIL